MGKTIFYLLGILSLHYTDITHTNAFFNLALPLFNLVFFIFLLWEALLFFSLAPAGEEESFYTWLYGLIDFRYDLIERGWLNALFHLAAGTFNLACYFYVIFYYFQALLERL